jgi:amidohydrolase
VRAELDRLGIAWQACAGTGTVAHLGEGRIGRCVAFRADLDALPLTEHSGVAWASEHDGCMHACGHDGHTASLLAAAAYLKSREADLPGPVVLLFQPAEEGGHGASKMIADGALDGVDAVFGFHNWPPMPEGSAACPLGPVMAANAEWTVTITGKGGHASAPHDGIDPIVCGANFVSAVQQVVSRFTAPQESAVVTVTCFHAGTADNIIPDSAELIGTVRAGTTERRDALAQRVEAVLHAACAPAGATAHFDYRPCYPATVNHAAEAELARGAIRAEMGHDALTDVGMPLMAAEDFGAFLRERPGAFLLIGAGRPGQPVEGCHSPRFDFNDALIPVVMRLWARLAGVPVDAPSTGVRHQVP